MSVDGGGTGGYKAAGWPAAEVEGGPAEAGVDGCDISSVWCCTLWIWRTCGSDSSSRLGSLHTRTGSETLVAGALNEWFAGINSGDLFVDWF